MNLSPDQLKRASADENEIALFDILKKLFEGWRWIVGGTTLGLFAGVGFLVFTPPQYETIGLVQVAHIGQVGKLVQLGQLGQVGQLVQLGQVTVAPVESMARVVERVMHPSFRETVLNRMGWADNEKGNVYRASLNAKVAKSNDLIEIRVRGLSPKDALSSLDATVAQLALLHKVVAQPMAESLQADLWEISAEIDETEKVLIDMGHSARLQAKAVPRDRLTALVLYEHLRVEKESHLRELRRKEKQYREWISPAGKADTVLFSEPTVSEEPVFPLRMRTLLSGMLGGLFFGIVAVVLRRGWWNVRMESPTIVIESGRAC